MSNKTRLDVLLVSQVDDIFEASSASLFADGLAAATEGPTLYEKGEAGWTPAGEVTG